MSRATVAQWSTKGGAQRPASGPTWRIADAALENVLADLEARQAEDDRLVAGWSVDELGRRRDELLLSVGRATGILLNLLARESGARAILELGTAAGYSTLWLAEAARATNGRVVTVDCLESRQQHARGALERAGLLDVVECRCADAIDFLQSTTARYDFALLDVWKDAYVPCVNALLPRLQPNALLVADNMREPATARLAAARYLAHVRTLGALETVVLPVGSGVAVSRYRPQASGVGGAGRAAGDE